MRQNLSTTGRSLLFCIAVLTCFRNGAATAAQQLVTINFDQSDWQDYSVYVEHGFTLTPNVGEVRVNNAFPPGSMAAQPSFGFGQGMDSSFTFRSQQHWAFTAVSIDLLEATGFPDTFGVMMVGTQANSNVVTQTFTLDGIAGAQTFNFSPEFTNLVSLKIGKDISDWFDIDLVQIDNVHFLVPAPGTEIRTRTGIYGQCFLASSNLTGVASSSGKIPTATIVWIHNTHSRLVKKCISNPVGQFYAYLPPGDYVLVGVSTSKTEAEAVAALRNPKLSHFRSDPITASVYPNQFTELQLNCGTIAP